MKSSKGISLIELVVTAALGANVLLGITSGYFRVMKGQTQVQDHSAVDLMLANAAHLILKVRRLAGAAAGAECVKQAAATLQCGIDFETPSIGTITLVRF